MRARSGAARSPRQARAGGLGQGEACAVRLEGPVQQGALGGAPSAEEASQGWLLEAQPPTASTQQIAATAHLRGRGTGQTRCPQSSAWLGDFRKVLGDMPLQALASCALIVTAKSGPRNQRDAAQMLAKLAPEAEARPQGWLGGDDLWAGRVWCPAMALSVGIRVLERNARCANLAACPNLAFGW